MFGGGIKIPDGPAVISVRHTRRGAVVTYPRLGRVAAAALTLLLGLGIWAWVLPKDAWDEPLYYALTVLLVAPGLWGVRRALEARPVALISPDELTVKYGPIFLERTVARLPLDSVEVRAGVKQVEVVLFDSRLAGRRLLAGLAPFIKAEPAKSSVNIYLFQVRLRGQAEWLSLFGSQAASEVENARLAAEEAIMRAAVVEADADEETTPPADGQDAGV